MQRDYLINSWLLITILMGLIACQPPVTPKPPAPSSSETTKNMQGILRGKLTGLAPSETVTLHLGLLKLDNFDNLRMELFNFHSPPNTDKGETIIRFELPNGAWQVDDLALEPGLYQLSLESEAYLSGRGSISFAVPEQGIAWRQENLNFQMIHPDDAEKQFGVPLCPELIPGNYRDYIIPETSATPTPTPTPNLNPKATINPSSIPKWPAGTCYAGHLLNWRTVLAGMVGQIHGLPDDEEATISIYALPPQKNESYSHSIPPESDSDDYWPPALTSLSDRPAIDPTWPLVAEVSAQTTEQWGLLAPGLAGQKYLVIAAAEGYTAEPTGYEVVVFSNRMPDIQGPVDFTFK